MSILGAMSAAVSGLNAQSRAIGAVSDNIANANTVGYKRVETTFSALVTQSNSTLHQPGGVIAEPVFVNSVAGNLQQNQNPTNIAITGPGFFSVSVAESVDIQTNNVSFADGDLFTRAGDFTLDKNGYLVNSSGYYLNGWAVDPVTKVVNTADVQAIQVSQLLDNPVATTTIRYAANLPATAATGTLPPSTIQVYDVLGNARDVTFTWEKTGANTWELMLDAPGATGAPFGPATFTFSNGVMDTLATGGGLTGATPAATGDPVEIGFTLNYAGLSAQPITLTLGNRLQPAGTTQYAGTDLELTSFEQNGVPRGAFKSVSVDEKGFVIVNYDNGQNKTYYQVPIVLFYNPNALTRVNGNAFQRTNDAGIARYEQPGGSGSGAIAANAVEGSNVDIAEEFSKMIVAQRSYSANARVISASDEMLQEVLNIKR